MGGFFLHNFRCRHETGNYVYCDSKFTHFELAVLGGFSGTAVLPQSDTPRGRIRLWKAVEVTNWTDGRRFEVSQPSLKMFYRARHRRAAEIRAGKIGENGRVNSASSNSFIILMGLSRIPTGLTSHETKFSRQ